jgi:hypothetical protein
MTPPGLAFPSASPPLLSTWETLSMKTGNGVPAATDRQEAGHVRDDSQLRDIEDLIAKLEVVTKQLAFPTRPMPTFRADGNEDVPAEDGD